MTQTLASSGHTPDFHLTLQSLAMRVYGGAVSVCAVVAMCVALVSCLCLTPLLPHTPAMPAQHGGLKSLSNCELQEASSLKVFLPGALASGMPPTFSQLLANVSLEPQFSALPGPPLTLNVVFLLLQ